MSTTMTIVPTQRRRRRRHRKSSIASASAFVVPAALIYCCCCVLLPTKVQAQRSALCYDFEEEGDDVCEMKEELELLQEEGLLPKDHGHETISLCNEVLNNFVGGNFSKAWDLEMYPDLFQDIPANSQLCSRLKTYFPFCSWCEERPCFDINTTRPSCDFESDYNSNEDFEQIMYTCANMDGFFETDPMNVTAHPELLLELGGLPEECRDFQHAYPHCYWCSNNNNNSNNTTVKEELEDDNNFLAAAADVCSFESLCSSLSLDDPNDYYGMEVTDVTLGSNSTTDAALFNATQVCAQIELSVRDGLTKALTGDLCNAAPLALATTCPQFCDRCFPKEDPPSCDEVPELTFYGVDKDDDEQDSYHPVAVCSELFYLIQRSGHDIFDLEAHGDALATVRAESPFCPVWRETYAHCFWCREDQSTYDCSEHPYCQETYNPPPYPGDDYEEFEAACHEFRLEVEEDLFPSTKDLCQKAEKYSQYCPCTYIETEIAYDYLGADTTAKKRALAWMPRAAALLSFVGASYILWDILSNKKNRTIVYYQLLVCMACFDIITALAWAFSTAPIPSYNVYGAHGTDATCTAQGFFIQLGFTSIFYNVALASYYWLVIVQNYTESKLQKLRPQLHLLPLTAGIGLALAGIPFYHGFDYACHLQPVPHGELWQVLLFAVIPIGLSILSITLVMVRLYLTVRTQSRASKKWRLGLGGNKKKKKKVSLEERVFWQALFYTLSFYLTWPLVLCVYVTGWDFEKENFGFSMLVAFVAPLQGFTNFLVFLRPKLKWWRSKSSSSSSSSYLGSSSRFFSRLWRGGNNSTEYAGWSGWFSGWFGGRSGQGQQHSPQSEDDDYEVPAFPERPSTTRNSDMMDPSAMIAARALTASIVSVDASADFYPEEEQQQRECSSPGEKAREINGPVSEAPEVPAIEEAGVSTTFFDEGKAPETTTVGVAAEGEAAGASTAFFDEDTTSVP